MRLTTACSARVTTKCTRPTIISGWRAGVLRLKLGVPSLMRDVRRHSLRTWRFNSGPARRFAQFTAARSTRFVLPSSKQRRRRPSTAGAPSSSIDALFLGERPTV
jgi:hypothetical protein